MSETKTKNLCTVPAADLTDSQYFIAEDGGELKRIPKAQVVLKKLENMLATDTENLAGGGEVTAQELLDALAEQVANKLLAKSQVVNNLLATVEGNPLDATQGKALKELIDTTNNNLSNGSVKSYFSPHKNNEADLCKGYNNSDGVFYFNYQGALVPIKKYVFSDGQGNGIFSSDQLVKNSDLPKNFKFLNLKYNTASSYDTEVLKYIESLKESVFIIYCQHGSASMYMGFIVGDGKYGTVLRFEYDSLYVNGCSGNAWAGWTKLG